MEFIDINFNRIKSQYIWSYVLSTIKGKSVRTGCTFMAKWYKYGPSSLSAICTYLLHPHLGPPTVSV